LRKSLTNAVSPELAAGSVRSVRVSVINNKFDADDYKLTGIAASL